MESKRNAWIQIPDFSSFEIGEVSRSEIEKMWGSRWAQKCIRDVAEQYAASRLSPFPQDRKQEFCSPQLGFENENGTLAVSPWTDVRPAILDGEPLLDFPSWTVYLNVKRGSRLFGIIPVDYTVEMVVSQDEALELVKLFFDHSPKEIPATVSQWKRKLQEMDKHRNVGLVLF